jgi:hypothetical protein
MSNVNPYATPQNNPHFPPQPGNPSFRKVFSNPIDLIQRSFALVKSNYWLFLGITLVGVLIGSVVPFGILLGAMMVGIFHCYLLHEAGQRFEFSDLFKGFDQFGNTLIAALIMVGTVFLLTIPLVIIFLVLMVGSGQGGNPPVGLFILFYIAIILVSLLVYIPFMFVFQLIAEYKLPAMDAVKLSVKAALANIGSVLVNLIALMFVSGILTAMCYVPGILFLPISMGWVFLLYRDIFPR